MSFTKSFREETPTMLETKAIMTALFYAFGVPITILGILENYGSWKADVLFWLSGVLITAKIIYFIINKDQDRKKRDLELEEKRYDFNEKKKTKA